MKNNAKNSFNFLIGAGGTGGHLFPAVAVIDELKKRYPLSNFYFVGRSDKIEGTIIPSKGYIFIPLRITGINKLLSFSTIRSLISLWKAKKELVQLIKLKNIDAVICTGAYISIPPGLAAIKTNTPLFLMESNVNPGRAIKKLAKKSTCIYSSFEKTADFFDKNIRDKIVLTGNPVRSDIIDFNKSNSMGFNDNFDSSIPTILIFGGSLGAYTINSFVINNIDVLSQKANIIWQTGKLFSINQTLPKNVCQMEFIDDMALAYHSADFIISRSGATTSAELCITGKPAILVPLKTSVNNEQEYNAKFLCAKTKLIYINNHDVNEKMMECIDYYLNNPDLLVNISENLLNLAKPNATMIIAESIINYLN